MFQSRFVRAVLVMAMLGWSGLAFGAFGDIGGDDDYDEPSQISGWGINSGSSYDYDYDPDHDYDDDDDESESHPRVVRDDLASNASLQHATYISLGYAERAVLKQLSDRRSAASQGAGPSLGLTPWVAPYYYHSRRNNMCEDGSVVKNDAGGSSLGLDFAWGDLLIGGAFDKGYSKTKYTHDRLEFKDEGDFYSFMGYADWERDRLRIYGAMGFAYDSHDMKYKEGGRLFDKADADSYAISSALICEYKLIDQAVYVKPYAGIRHAYINSDSYKIGSVHYNPKHQNIYRFPVGLKVGHDFNLSGFLIRPLFNIGMEPVRGDTKSKTTVRSLGTKETSKANMCDEFYWNASAGVTCAIYGISCTLAYEFQGSGHDKEHGVSFSYNWRF